MSLSDHLKDFTIISEDEVIAGSKVKESIKELIWQIRFNDSLKTVEDRIGMIKELFGDKLVPVSEVKRNGT